MSVRSSTDFWRRYGLRLLPFADAASTDLPLSRILRLALFQFSAGMCFVLLNGTLNRVMIVELGVMATLVSLMIAVPLVIAPLRALIGHRSDQYVSYLGWRRVPFLFIGTMLQFGGLAILPFALIILSGDTHWPAWYAKAATALAFLLVGLGMHTTQTAGLALATDIAPAKSRTRVVALLYVMLLVGMVVSSLVFAALLEPFSQIRLIQVLQAAAVLTLFLNLAACYKQEARNRAVTNHQRTRPAFASVWLEYISHKHTRRFLIALALGTSAFGMQDILLEPYAGHALGLGVGATTLLTGILVTGMLGGFSVAAKLMAAKTVATSASTGSEPEFSKPESKRQGTDPSRIAAYGATLGAFAFSAIILAAPFGSVPMIQTGTFVIGMGSGMFSVGMLATEMARQQNTVYAGMALGAWGAVQATAAGVAIALGGSFRDLVSQLATHNIFGQTLNSINTGYQAVYLIEIVLLFITLVILGPIVGRLDRTHADQTRHRVGLSVFPT